MFYFNSFEGLQKRELTMITDEAWIKHLVVNEVNFRWLKLHYPTFTFNRMFMHYNDKPTVNVFDCAGLGLAGNELNDITV